jgi:choline dehydrogenase-like flavoprotein
LLGLITHAIDRSEVSVTVQDSKGRQSEHLLDLGKLGPEFNEEQTLQAIGLEPWRLQVPPIAGEVTHDSPARRAGMHSGDRIISVGGEKVESWSWIGYLVQTHGHENQPLAVTIERNGEILELEILPRKENRMMLDENHTDRFGIPQMKFDVVFRENELNMLADATDQAVRMLKAAGCTDIEARSTPYPPGTGIHEMGGARMGDDPRESVLNRWNQLHDAPNLFVTDGAAMTSASCVNPSITYMALTARAADRAVEMLKANQL